MNDNSNYNDNKKRVEVPSFVNNTNIKNQPRPRSSSRLGNYEDSDSFMKDVNSSLAKQVEKNMDKTRTSPNKRNRKKKRKRLRVLKALFYSLLAISALCCILLFTDGGQKFLINMASRYIYGNLDYNKSEEANGNKIDEPFKVTDKIVNILLIGVEEIDNARNTDSMIIATMNTENHTLKLTSIMRDLYVDIPGHGKNRLNAAYSLGKIDLLSSTIEQNLGVKIDGYCSVNFDSFEKIVDIVHGVEVTLTPAEAEYLNTTNYISEKKYRNVKPGKQTLNGNQALGYCRVRKRSTATESNDFGRTQRHRIVLNAIFDKVKSKNVIEMAFLMNKILNSTKIDTNITQKEFTRYLNEAVSLKVKKLDTFRVPTDDNYANEKVTIGSRKNREVITAKDWDKLRLDLKNYIEGTPSTDSTDDATDNSSNDNNEDQ